MISKAWIAFTNWIFGSQWVMLILHDGDVYLRRAVKLGDYWYATPYLSNTRTALRPQGKVVGQCYVTSWRPVTYLMYKLYKGDNV